MVLLEIVILDALLSYFKHPEDLIIRKIIICYSNALSDKMIRLLVKIYKYKQSYIVYIWNRKEEKIHDLSGFQKDIKI